MELIVVLCIWNIVGIEQFWGIQFVIVLSMEQRIQLRTQSRFLIGF